MKIAMYDLEGNFLEVFENLGSVRDLERELKIPQSSLNNCLKGKINSTINRQFRLVYSDKILTKIGDVSDSTQGKSNRIIVKMYKGKIVSTYNTLKEAALKNGLNESCISRCLDDKQRKSGGFQWKYM